MYCHSNKRPRWDSQNDRLVEPPLVDRHLSCPQLLDPLGENVANDDVVTELGKARAGHQTDVTSAEDCHSAHGR